MRYSHQRMAVGTDDRKHAHLNPTQTVLQYYSTTVRLYRYDSTTTRRQLLQYCSVRSTVLHCSWLLALGSWLLALGSWLLALGS